MNIIKVLLVAFLTLGSTAALAVVPVPLVTNSPNESGVSSGGSGSCTPACFAKNCGSDGCGGSCGTCPNGSTCSTGICKGSLSNGSDCYLNGYTCQSGYCDDYAGMCSDGTIGTECYYDNNCQSGYCSRYQSICTDGSTGKSCSFNSNCQSNVCVNHVCS